MPKASPSKGTVNPSAMTAEDAARMLTTLGSKNVDADAIRQDIDDGAPTNEDGTLNVLDYTAWLVTKISGRRGRRGS